MTSSLSYSEIYSHASRAYTPSIDRHETRCKMATRYLVYQNGRHYQRGVLGVKYTGLLSVGHPVESSRPIFTTYTCVIQCFHRPAGALWNLYFNTLYRDRQSLILTRWLISSHITRPVQNDFWTVQDRVLKMLRTRCASSSWVLFR